MRATVENDMTRKQSIQKALNELEKAGIVKRNGLFRGGQPVYVTTNSSSELEEICSSTTYYNPTMNTLLRPRAADKNRK
jgi:predicted transcriptional regulator